MGVTRVALVVIGFVLAGCGTGAASPPTSGQPPAPSDSQASPLPSLSLGPSFVVIEPDASPTVAPTPTAMPDPTAVPVPAKPTGVAFRVVRRVELRDGYRETFRVTWKAPRSEGLEIRVWGVTECLSEPEDPQAGTSGPCLVRHTALPESVRTLISTVPASAGKVTWTWHTLGECNPQDLIWRARPAPDGQTFYAIVLAAYNRSGHSVFAIAQSAIWFRLGPDEMVC